MSATFPDDLVVQCRRCAATFHPSRFCNIAEEGWRWKVDDGMWFHECKGRPGKWSQAKKTKEKTDSND